MLFFKSRRYVILFIEWMKEIHPKTFEEKFKTTSILSNLISNQITLNTAEQMNHGHKIHLAPHLPLPSYSPLVSSSLFLVQRTIVMLRAEAGQDCDDD